MNHNSTRNSLELKISVRKWVKFVKQDAFFEVLK